MEEGLYTGKSFYLFLAELLWLCSFGLCRLFAGRSPRSASFLKKHLGFHPLKPNAEDKLLLAEGFDSYILIRWGEPLNSKESFGFNNDYLAYLTLGNSKQEALLWANHEAPDPPFCKRLLR